MTLSGDLYLTEELKAKQDLHNKMNAAKTIGQVGTASGGSMALALSLVNQDPSSLFDFLNTAEMLYSVYLFNLDLNPILKSFQIGMRLQSSVPNFFYLIIDSNQGVSLSSSLQNYGFSTNLVILNSGPYIETLISLLLSSLALFILSKFTWCRSKLNSTIKNFRFSAFIRFWIQSYFEIGTCIYLAFKYSANENTVQMIDYCFCFIFIVGFI